MIKCTGMGKETWYISLKHGQSNIGIFPWTHNRIFSFHMRFGYLYSDLWIEVPVMNDDGIKSFGTMDYVYLRANLLITTQFYCETSPILIKKNMRIEDTIGRYTLSNTIIEAPVEVFFILLRFIGITKQWVGIDHWMSLIVVSADHPLYGMSYEVYIDRSGHIVCREINPIHMLHIGTGFFEFH